MKILVIDDDASVRDAFELALSDSHAVSLAADGAQGLQLAQADPPDLIFLDLRMPGLDGVEVLRRLRAAGYAGRVYIVTAFASQFMQPLQAAREEGLAFQLASKPLSPSQIRQTVRVAGML